METWSKLAYWWTYSKSTFRISINQIDHLEDDVRERQQKLLGEQKEGDQPFPRSIDSRTCINQDNLDKVTTDVEKEGENHR